MKNLWEEVWEEGTNVYINNPGHMTKMAAISIYGNQRTNGFVNTHLRSAVYTKKDI